MALQKGLSKNSQMKLQNIPGKVTETILEQIDNLITKKLDCLIIDAGTNDQTKGVNSLNCI